VTLVVARIAGDQIAIAADTMLTAGDMKLPMSQWVLKSICLPGGICVSYCNSPDLAFRSFRAFRRDYPTGAGFADVVAFFEKCSSRTNNDFIIAFAHPARLVTVRDGKRTAGVSHTHWIGDYGAYRRFRQCETGANRIDDGRAINAAVFADEMHGSPASDLYSAMQNVVRDESLSSVGGLVTVLSNREGQFRFSVYSDALFDWPQDRLPNLPLDINEKLDLEVSGENDRFSLSQISPGYYDLNAVAFYYLKGRLLILLSETKSGCQSRSISNIKPDEIAEALDQHFGFPFLALCLVMSARSDQPLREGWRAAAAGEGVGLSLFCEVNTMSRIDRL
jgi:hypothetical protein